MLHWLRGALKKARSKPLKSIDLNRSLRSAAFFSECMSAIHRTADEPGITPQTTEESMRSPSSTLILFGALTGVLLLPALSFAGPNGHHQGRHSKARYKQGRGPGKQHVQARHGHHATNRVRVERRQARRAKAIHRHTRRPHRRVTYRAPVSRRVVHGRRHVTPSPSYRYATGRRYHRPVRGFHGNSVRLLRRGICRTNVVRYSSGRVAAAGKCGRGLKRGTWRAFDRRGRILASARFRRGVKVSSWTRYDGHRLHRRGKRYGKAYGSRRVSARPVYGAPAPRQHVRIARTF